MKVLMLSQDMKIFEDGSNAAVRMASYSAIADELTIVVFGAGEPREKALAPAVRAVSPGGKNKFDAYLRGAGELFSQVKKNRPGVISSQDPFFIGCAGLLAGAVNSIPFQAQLHTDCFSFAFATQSFRQMIETVLAFFVIQGATCVRAVSKRIARSIMRFSDVPVAILPIRVPEVPKETFAKPAEFSNRFSVLSVARLTREKQLTILIDAVSKLPDADLILVGEGPLRADLEKRAASLGITERVKFTGWKNPHPYYAHANVFVSMSRFEGYGISLMEAALHGLPIISTDVGIIRDVLENGADALVVKPDSEALHLALALLQKDEALRHRLGGSARKKAAASLVSESAYLAGLKTALSACDSKTAS